MKTVFAILFLCSVAVSQQAAVTQSSKPPSMAERPDLWIRQPDICHGNLCDGVAYYKLDQKRWAREQRAKRMLARRGAKPEATALPATEKAKKHLGEASR